MSLKSALPLNYYVMDFMVSGNNETLLSLGTVHI